MNNKLLKNYLALNRQNRMQFSNFAKVENEIAIVTNAEIFYQFPARGIANGIYNLQLLAEFGKWKVEEFGENGAPDFPIFPEMKFDSIMGEISIDDIKKTLSIESKTGYDSAGIFANLNGELAATDGHRLHIINYNAKSEMESGHIIPWPICKLLSTLGNCKVNYSKDKEVMQFHFFTNEILAFRLPDSKYPNYRAILTQQFTGNYKIQFPVQLTKEIKESLKLAKVGGHEIRNNAMTIYADAGGEIIYSIGERAFTFGECAKAEFSISINSSFLIDAIENDWLDFYYIDKVSAVLFGNPEKEFTVIMPLNNDAFTKNEIIEKLNGMQKKEKIKKEKDSLISEDSLMKLYAEIGKLQKESESLRGEIAKMYQENKNLREELADAMARTVQADEPAPVPDLTEPSLPVENEAATRIVERIKNYAQKTKDGGLKFTFKLSRNNYFCLRSCGYKWNAERGAFYLG